MSSHARKSVIAFVAAVATASAAHAGSISEIVNLALAAVSADNRAGIQTFVREGAKVSELTAGNSARSVEVAQWANNNSYAIVDVVGADKLLMIRPVRKGSIQLSFLDGLSKPRTISTGEVEIAVSRSANDAEKLAMRNWSSNATAFDPLNSLTAEFITGFGSEVNSSRRVLTRAVDNALKDAGYEPYESTHLFSYAVLNKDGTISIVERIAVKASMVDAATIVDALKAAKLAL